MQIFYKFVFLASLLALATAAPAVSLEGGGSLTLFWVTVAYCC